MTIKRNYVPGKYVSISNVSIGRVVNTSGWVYFKLDKYFKFELADIELYASGELLREGTDYQLAKDDRYTKLEIDYSCKILYGQVRFINSSLVGKEIFITGLNFGSMIDNEAMVKYTDDVGHISGNNNEVVVSDGSGGASGSSDMLVSSTSQTLPNMSITKITAGPNSQIPTKEYVLDAIDGVGAGLWQTDGAVLKPKTDPNRVTIGNPSNAVAKLDVNVLTGSDGRITVALTEDGTGPGGVGNANGVYTYIGTQMGQMSNTYQRGTDEVYIGQVTSIWVITNDISPGHWTDSEYVINTLSPTGTWIPTAGSGNTANPVTSQSGASSTSDGFNTNGDGRFGGSLNVDRNVVIGDDQTVRPVGEQELITKAYLDANGGGGSGSGGDRYERFTFGIIQNSVYFTANTKTILPYSTNSVVSQTETMSYNPAVAIHDMVPNKLSYYFEGYGSVAIIRLQIWANEYMLADQYIDLGEAGHTGVVDINTGIHKCSSGKKLSIYLYSDINESFESITMDLEMRIVHGN